MIVPQRIVDCDHYQMAMIVAPAAPRMSLVRLGGCVPRLAEVQVGMPISSIQVQDAAKREVDFDFVLDQG